MKHTTHNVIVIMRLQMVSVRFSSPWMDFKGLLYFSVDTIPTDLSSSSAASKQCVWLSNRGEQVLLTLQKETNRESGSSRAAWRTSPVRTLSGLIGRRLSFSSRESSLNTSLEGQDCVTLTHNLISGTQFRRESNWESLMKCLVITGSRGIKFKAVVQKS